MENSITAPANTAQSIQKTYLILTALNTLAASFIWGVNTLFLLDAGLSNAQAFAANAFFTVGQVLFEIPTGVVADTFGRRASYLAGSGTLVLTTFAYLLLWKYEAGFVGWALVSALLGLGFTFFSGSVEAWLVDALDSVKFDGQIEDVFAKGQIASGISMVIGSTLGGFIAQATNLGIPYVIRCGVLGLSLLAAYFWMRDMGFEPRRPKSYLGEMKMILQSSLKNGLGNPAVRWMMLVGPFMAGVSIYGFYAAQPLLLQLYGDQKAYGIAGLAASLVALAQVAGGFMVPYLRKAFSRRSSLVAVLVVGSAIFMVLAGTTSSFTQVLIFISLWGLLGAALMPVQRAYLNKLISSKERATVLSFDGMLSSAGGSILQPGLGRSADIWGYPFSFVISGSLQLLALPFVYMVRRENSPADYVRPNDEGADKAAPVE